MNNLEEIHNELFELLVAFDNLCEKAHVNYSLHGGTLIGAIRYSDFIPWDDDADVTILSWDYIKLKKFIEADLSCEYRFADEDGLGHRFTRKRLDGRVMAWIDVIEYNYVTKNIFLRQFRNVILICLAAMSKSKQQVRTATVEKHGVIKILIFKVLYYMGYIIGKKRVLAIHRYISRNWFLGDKKIMQRTNDQVAALKRLIPVDWYKNYDRHLLHGHSFMITKNYHDVLAQVYGQNWITPPAEEKRVPHENIVRSAYMSLQEEYEKN